MVQQADDDHHHHRDHHDNDDDLGELQLRCHRRGQWLAAWPSNPNPFSRHRHRPSLSHTSGPQARRTQNDCPTLEKETPWHSWEAVQTCRGDREAWALPHHGELRRPPQTGYFSNVTAPEKLNPSLWLSEASQGSSPREPHLKGKIDIVPSLQGCGCAGESGSLQAPRFRSGQVRPGFPTPPPQRFSKCY